METPGQAPADDYVLYDQENHISSKLLLGEEIEYLRLIPADPKSQHWKLTPTMKENVRNTGLHHLAGMRKAKIDHALINALIETWRPETNTFLLQSGEAAITLEDISYLYGLPIDGKPVTGRVWSTRATLEETVRRLLGLEVNKSAYLRGGQLSLPWIQKMMNDQHVTGETRSEERYARAYLFCLVASQIWTCNSGLCGHTYLLEVFESFERYAWGPACLACIYRTMTQATRVKDRLRTITSPLQLLQIWAYSRTALARPMRMQLKAVQFEFPMYKMWHPILQRQSFATTLQDRRNQLANDGSHGEFEWQPYEIWIEHLREEVDLHDRQIFHSTVPLIYYWIIERHNVDRVYKQFGLIQPIPPPLHRWESAPLAVRMLFR